jgi:hypothetical protein
MALGEKSGQKVRIGDLLPAVPGQGRQKLKRAGKTGPIRILFLLPVGLADFMGRDATVE